MHFIESTFEDLSVHSFLKASDWDFDLIFLIKFQIYN